MRGLLILVIIAVILIAGNGCNAPTGAVTACISPEVQINERCCIDFDENRICDDEQKISEPNAGEPLQETIDNKKEPPEQETAPEQKTYTIEMRGFRYDPQELEISVGDTVIWINKEDAVPHAVYEINGKFRSNRLTPGQEFKYTFTETGIYNFSDQIFEKLMRGKIIVR